MKRILINATQAEELRVAMVNGQLLYDLDIEVPSREQKKSNIYKGVITRIEPSLEAAFVNYGSERHGFLPFKEISRHYFDEKAKDSNGRYIIKDAIKVGQELIVQVEKEERGNKGAALTSFISLAGRFLVAMPQNPRAGGVSRRIEGEDRDQVRDVMAQLNMPENMGVIARTAGVGRSAEEMQWDLDYLVQLWGAIEEAAAANPAPFLIYQESDIVIRALRDHYKSDVGEILIDSKHAYDRAHEFMSMVMPNSVRKLKLFEDKQPLFNRYQIENQIESAFNRTVNLPSGGAIVIDHTEALTSIDVNSARATKGGDIEETALSTNLEAADEIARQLRIRDLGGLIVIDFIDMLKNKNQRDVEQRLRRAVYDDRARVQIGRISRFGLLEMSRQRLRPSLGESSQIVCPRCCGQGTIRDVESLSLAVLRLLEEEALKENTGRILAKLPIEVATYLLNEKRDKVAMIEKRNAVHCVVVPDPKLETPHFEIERIRDNDTLRHESSFKSSYEMTTEDGPGYTPDKKPQVSAPPPQAAVSRIAPTAAPMPTNQDKEEKSEGLISKVFGVLFGRSEKTGEDEEETRTPRKKAASSSKSPDRSRGRPSASRNNKRNQKSSRQQSDNDRAAAKSEDNKDKRQEGGENRKKSAQKRGRGGRGNQRRNASGRQSDTASNDQKQPDASQDSPAKSTDKDTGRDERPRKSSGGKRPARARASDKSREDQSSPGNESSQRGKPSDDANQGRERQAANSGDNRQSPPRPGDRPDGGSGETAASRDSGNQQQVSDPQSSDNRTEQRQSDSNASGDKTNARSQKPSLTSESSPASKADDASSASDRKETANQQQQGEKPAAERASGANDARKSPPDRGASQDKPGSSQANAQTPAAIQSAASANIPSDTGKKQEPTQANNPASAQPE